MARLWFWMKTRWGYPESGIKDPDPGIWDRQ